MKKYILLLIIILLASIFVLFKKNFRSKGDTYLLTLANIEALGFNEEDDPCSGNPFYASDQALKSVRCMKYPFVFGYKLSCKSESGRCCDPTTQTKCE